MDAAPSIYHRQMGSLDNPPLIAIHGLFGSLDNLGVVTRKLSEDYCVYAIDLPNHGRSAHTEGVITLERLASLVLEWMDSMSIKAAHFLGHSLGGKVSMEIALRCPERLQKLIVADISPVQYSRRHQDVFDAFNSVDLHTITSRADADQAMRPHVSELSTRSFLLKNLERNEQGWFWRVNLTDLIASYDYLIAANTDDMPAFTKNVLFIKGELSPYILSEHKDAIVNLFPNASVKVINGTHHWLHAEKPGIFTGIVKRFLTL